MPADDGSTGGYVWSTAIVPGVRGHIHNREHCLCNSSKRSGHARGTDDPRRRWWRHLKRQPDYPVRPDPTSPAAPVPGNNTTGVRTWDEYCSITRRCPNQDKLALVSYCTPHSADWLETDLVSRVFYINLPFCCIGLVTIPFFLRYERPETTLYHKLSSIDWIGSILTIVSSTSFLVGVSWGGNQFRWDSAAVLVPILAGLGGVAFTVFYESSIAKNPFLRLSLFQHWSCKVAFLCTMLQGYLVS
jgi:hypothetical protein